MKKRLLATLLVLVMCPALLCVSANAWGDDRFKAYEKEGFHIYEDLTFDCITVDRYTGPGGHVVIPDGVQTIFEKTFSNRPDITSVTLPNSLRSIGPTAFYKTGLTEVTLPDNVEKIGGSAFAETGLTRVFLPKNVSSVGGNAFGTGLTGFLVDAENPYFAQQNGVLFNKEGTTLVSCPAAGVTGEYTIPSSVTNVGRYAFFGCAGLTSIQIPNSVTEIDDGAFEDCIGLDTIHIPDSVTSLGTGVFEGCTSLTGVDYPKGIARLPLFVFQNCTGLTSIHIPDDSMDIPMFAFRGCTGLTEVYIPESVRFIGSGAFAGCDALRDIYYEGDETGWEQIKVSALDQDYTSTTNKPLKNATIHYNTVFTRSSAEPEKMTGTAYASTQPVLVDGVSMEFQCYALKDANGNDTNYIKLRDVASILSGSSVQFNVGWDGAVNIETGKGYVPNGSEMSTPFRGDRAYETATAETRINGKTAALDAIVLKDDNGGGYTYFKLRDLGTALGFTVDWSADKGIFIETK